MRNMKCKFHSGFTLMELVITMLISPILALVVGILLVSGNRAWQRTFNSTQKQIKQDAQAVTIVFESMARRTNRLGYTIYEVNGNIFTPAVPRTSNRQEVVSGDAVEFRYWNVDLDKTDSYKLMDVAKTATVYALFYIDDNQLKVDYGPYPPGAVPHGGGIRNASGVTTKVLTDNVSTDSNSNIGAFNHTILNGVGTGCVRINITLTDPEDDEIVRVMTAALLRNIWPR
jgi:prepilin-type N-terminal cleavage/methylation domain-containing protein